MKRRPWLWLVCCALLSPMSHAEESIFQHGEAPLPGLGGALDLIDHHGQRFSLKSLEQPALVFFGFSRCATVCPLALFQAKQVLDTFQSRRAPTIVFVTLDPLSDDPASLAKFLAQFDVRIVGLTGSPSKIEQAAAGYGVSTRGSNADIEHSARWYLVDGDAHVVRVYNSATPGGLIANDIIRAQHVVKVGVTKGMP